MVEVANEQRLEENRPLREAVEVIREAIREAQYIPGMVGPHITGIKLQARHKCGLPILVGTTQFNHSAEDERFVSFLVDKLEGAGVSSYRASEPFGDELHPTELTDLVISYPHGRVSRQKRAKIKIEDIRGENLKALVQKIAGLTKGPDQTERLQGKVTVWANPNEFKNPLRTTMLLDRDAHTDEEQGFQRQYLSRMFSKELKAKAVGDIVHQYTPQTRFEIDLASGEVTEIGPFVADELARAEQEVSNLAHKTYNDAVPELRSLGELELGPQTSAVIEGKIIPGMHREDGKLSSVVFDVLIGSDQCSVNIRSSRTDSEFSFVRKGEEGNESLREQLKEAVAADYGQMASAAPEALCAYLIIAAKSGKADVRAYQRVSLSGLRQATTS